MISNGRKLGMTKKVGKFQNLNCEILHWGKKIFEHFFYTFCYDLDKDFCSADEGLRLHSFMQVL